MNRPDSNKTASADRILTGIGLAIAEAKMVRSQLSATTDSTRSPHGHEYRKKLARLDREIEYLEAELGAIRSRLASG